MNTSQHLQHSDCPVYCFWNRYLLFSWLKNYFRKMDFSPTEVDYDKWIESAALNSQVTFQVAWYSHWAFLSSELIASEKWVANILLWLPSILFSLLKIVYRGPNCLSLYWEENIVAHTVYVYLAELLHYSLLLNDSYAGPELKSTHLTECRKRHTKNENRQ